MVYITCIIFNIVKISQIYVYLSYVPFRKLGNVENLSKQEFDDLFKKYYNGDMGRYKTLQWANFVIEQIVSCIYDISVITALKSCLFDKMKDTSKSLKSGENNFLSRFKQISEYRIIISMVATITAFPIILCFALFLFRQFLRNETIISDTSADSIRTCVLDINYTLMYIDQILLRYYVDGHNRSKSRSNNNTFTNPVISYSNSINKPSIISYDNYGKGYTIESGYTTTLENSSKVNLLKKDSIDRAYTNSTVKSDRSH
eukprot:jgi/Orpsp1_1/1188309/evm.model.d7180000063807.1